MENKNTEKLLTTLAAILTPIGSIIITLGMFLWEASYVLPEYPFAFIILCGIYVLFLGAMCLGARDIIEENDDEEN